ncbi:MAG: recombination and repair protein RecO [Labilithrix sp.]|nr:recombination and repair protein RecO [Labilithrix sp.]
MRRIESAALLVRSVAFGESDVIATFFTATDGKLSAMVRGARRSQKRFGGALEPIHELFTTFEDKGKELVTLKEARLGRPREGIVRSLDTMDAAGRALRWIRHLCPPRTPEPEIWSSLGSLFDVLDALGHGGAAEAGLVTVLDQHLVVFAFGLLARTGYSIDFERCVRCGKVCPAGRPAFLDGGGGGLVCMECGGARRTVSAELRRLAVRAQQRDRTLAMSREEASALVAIAEEAMSVHADFDPHGSGGRK